MKSKNSATDIEFLHRTREAERASCVADELRNPITSIRTCLEMLPDKPGKVVDENDLKLLRLIREETDRLGHLIQEIVTCSKDCGVEPALISLNTIVHAVVKRVQRESGLSGQDIVVKMPEEAKVRGNVLQLERVIESLLTNSLEAFAGKPGSIVIKHFIDEDRSWQWLRVQDSGPGIPKHLGNRVFDRFVSGSETRVGLGLAIARQVVQAHGGDIVWLEAENGCCLEIRFPFYEIQEELGKLAV